MELTLCYSQLTILIAFAFRTVLSVGSHTYSDTGSDSTDEWCYEEPTCGEEAWIGPCAYNEHQSPIDLPGNLRSIHKSPSSLEIMEDFPKSELVFDGFEIGVRGHAVQVKPVGKSFSFVRKLHPGRESISYSLAGIDFHWGKVNGIGSEHTISKVSYSGEVHLAFYESSRNASTYEDVDGLDAFLVIGILLDVDISGILNTGTSKFMEGIVEAVGQLKSNGSIHISKKLDLVDLFSGNIMYKYPGSFTTPPCQELEWWVMRKPVMVPMEHLEALRNAKVDGVPLAGNNFRSLMRRRSDDISLLKLSYV